MKLSINYTLSGVKLAKVFGRFLLLLSVICLLPFLGNFGYFISNIGSDKDYMVTSAYEGLTNALICLGCSVTLIAFGGVCLCLSTIAKAALYQCAEFESKYDIETITEKQN